MAHFRDRMAMQLATSIGLTSLVSATLLGLIACGQSSSSNESTSTGGSSTGGSSGGGSSGSGANGGAHCDATPATSVAELMSDAELRGEGLGEDLITYSFSQSEPDQIDPQIVQLGPTVSIRTTNQWGRSGRRVEDYDAQAIAALKATGTRAILGLTHTVIFEDEFDDPQDFEDAVTRSANGEPVKHDYIVPNAYRGNVASPTQRTRVVDTAKALIDAGADGIFFDEVNSGYSGAILDASGNYLSEEAGNEGFDDYHEADFRQFLCATHPEWTPDVFASTFGTPADNTLDCGQCGGAFSMRRYLSDNGWLPSTASGPLVTAWGTPTQNRNVPDPASFTEIYNIVYWADVVRRVRRYAREQHDREVWITSNGLFPFVDFQSVGLYPWNPDSSESGGVEYVPQTPSGGLDGTVSLIDAFARLRDQSHALAGPVPIVLFIDWPTEMLEAYNDTFTNQERRDYFRLYGAEAYASGLRFAWHLKTSIPDDPTASDHGMLDWFASEAEWYRAHRALYAGAVPASHSVRVPSGISTTVTELPNGSHVVHVINHHYEDGLQEQSNLSVEVVGLTGATTATLASPDADEDSAITLDDSSDGAAFVVPVLRSYAAIRVE